MSGIKERRLWEKGARPSDGAVLAGAKAIERSDVKPGDLGAVVMCSVCKDFLEPATACVAHDALGLSPDALVFDMSNACLGVLTGMMVMGKMVENGVISSALLLAGENSGPLLETTINTILNDSAITRQTIKPHFASLTIGSGAVAVVLSKSSESNAGKPRLVAASHLAATDQNDLCRGNADTGMLDGARVLMNTDSETLMLKGVEAAAKTWGKFKNETGWRNEDPDVFCAHQVGTAHRRLLYDSLEIDLGKDFSTLEYFGNTGSVSCPMTFAKALESNDFPKGSKVALLGIGSGINCAMMGVEWL
jgi:3-oxoacyl-[acyl-carrier-protein] synthase-3